MWVTSSTESNLQPTHVALGNFDGIHLGHRAVIEALFIEVESPACSVQAPLELQSSSHDAALLPRLSAPTTCYPTVVSFNPHPHAFFSGQPKPLLTVLSEKVAQLERLGIAQLVLLPFNRELADLLPEDFVEQVLVQQLKAQKVSVGFDFCFGRDRSGTAADLQAIAARYGIPVLIAPPQMVDGERISSSEIRLALAQGDPQRAQRLLGRPYSLSGTVAQGQQLGRTLGFPTANLSVAEEKFIPLRGVYSVWVESALFPTPQLGVMNIGLRPTVSGSRETIEVHLLDWAGDLYGHTLTVHLHRFLRPEQKFASLDALKAQIGQDCKTARAQLTELT
ncbi:MAG TPA: bifunctional riboflavin kinase/FAD synthetase [Stenomitos sp.]